MEFIVYEPLSERKPDFPSNLVTAFTAVESYEYCRNWQDIGEFSLTVPIDTEGIESVREDMLLIVNDDYNTDSLVITSIINNGKNIVLKGFDLKVMMKWRVTVFPDIEFDKGTYGYDVAQGNTGEIIEHYIERNFINPRDSNRKIYGLRADNLGGGIRTDTYMSRMEPVNEVIEKLCKNADIGYDIDARNDGYEVSIRPGTERTNSKTVFEKVVFADFTMDADGITVETSVNDRGNIIWAVNGGDADNATVISVDNSKTDSDGNVIDPEETEGFMRREIVTTTNCDIDEIQLYAQKSAEEKFNKTTITFELKDYTMFINRFCVGDIITVLKGGKEYNKRVLSACKRYSGNAKTISITLGDIPERKPLKKLYYNSYENKQGIIDENLKDIEETKKPSPSPSSVLSQVSFEKNRLYYNGETYHLQFGWNKRIMCVTKGDKHALINSPDYTGSRIEAATAVMKGLTEDWDIVFDNYCCENAEGYTLNLSSILKNYSGAVKCDWGDGTSDNETSHTYYNTACVVVKIKLLGDIPSEMQINSMDIMWSVTTNERFWVHNIGARLYIGGLIKGAYITSHGNSVTHICYGENVKTVKGSLSYPSVAERQFEVGIPPFVENISGTPYQYNGASYIYIPESCVSITNMAFAYNGASEIETEEKGGARTIGANAFGYTASKENYNRLDVLRLPARVVQEKGYSILEDCYIRAVIYGRGRTEIPSQLCYRAENGGYLSEIEDKPYFIFIPRTVTSIGDFLLYPYSNPKRQVYIICEGSWSSITKSSNWDGASGGRENVKIYSESCLYNSAENIIKTFIKGR